MDVSGTWLLRRPQQACLESKHRVPRFPAVTNISFPNTTFTRSLFWNTIPNTLCPRCHRTRSAVTTCSTHSQKTYHQMKQQKTTHSLRRFQRSGSHAEGSQTEICEWNGDKRSRQAAWREGLRTKGCPGQDDLFQGFRLSQGHVPSIRNVVVSQERDLPTPMPSRGWWMVLACFGTKPGRNMFCFVWIARLSPMCSVWTMRRHLGTCLRSGAVSYCFAPWKN